MSLKKKLSIHIKKKNEGLLHKKMGIDEDKSIGYNKLDKEEDHAKATGNTKLEKEVVFAKNAKKWHNG